MAEWNRTWSLGGFVSPCIYCVVLAFFSGLMLRAEVIADFSAGIERVILHADYPGDSPEILLNIEGQSRPLRFSVDTGASSTLMDTRTAAQIGIEGTGERSIGGAG